MNQRWLKLAGACKYLDKSEPNFNETVRPYLTVIPDGRCVKFDIVDLDAWADEYKRANGKPAKEELLWQKEPQVLERKATSGILKKLSAVSSFDKALEKRNLSKQSAI